MISIQELQHSYKKGKKTVLNIPTLTFDELGVTGIVGHNGSGKSTLLSCVAGLTHPTQGRVRYQQRDTWQHYESIKKDIPLVADEIPLYGSETGWQLIRLVKSLDSNWNQALEDELIPELMIPLDDKVVKLSRGERTKLKILLTLCRNPKVVLIDELTNDLDVETRRIVFKKLDAYSFEKEATILVATNIIHDIERFANRIVLLKEGQILATEDIDSLKNRFKKISLKKTDAYKGTSIKHIHHDELKWDGSTGSMITSAFDSQVLTSLEQMGIATKLENFPLEEIITRLGGSLK